MQGASEDHLREMKRIIHYMLHTKNKGLKMEPIIEEDETGRVKHVIKGICDATWSSDKDERVDEEGMSLYKSGTGSLMYLLKHSRPELSNCIRELSKAMQGASEDHLREMKRIIHYMLHTKNKGLKMEPIIEEDETGRVKHKIKGICDATWSSDKDDGRSVSGFIIYYMGVPISWRSRTQKHVVLSSTEAEYVGISEVVKEIMFVKQFLEELNIIVEKPIKVYVDNVGAIYMSKSNLNSTATRHVNIRYHYVREFVADGLIEIIFVRTDDNDSDLMTKNLHKGPFEKHSDKLVEEIPEMYILD